MNIIELFILALGLSMDALAVAICKGLVLKKTGIKSIIIVGLWFGGFQALMPLIGFLVGVQFREQIAVVDHWIAFGLLALIGINMVRESFSRCDIECDIETDNSLSLVKMFPLAVATSIDALAIGVSFAVLNVNITLAAAFIGITTFILSAAGVKIGNIFGIRYKNTAQFIGGIILVCMGTKILIEHLF